MPHKEAAEVPKPQQGAPEYNSNPFTLAFRSMVKLFSTNANWAIAAVVLAFLGAVGQGIGDIGRALSEPSSTNTLGSSRAGPALDATVIIAIAIVVFVILLVAVVVGTVFSVFVQGMFAHVALESEKGRTVSLNEAFTAVTKRFWRLFLARLLANLKIFGWTLLLIVPGIIASLRYKLLTYVIMSEPEGSGAVAESHTRVKAVTKGRLMEVFGVETVAAIVPFIGSLLSICGGAALYRQLSHYTDNNIQKPAVHILNYLGFLLLILLIGFIIMITALVLVIAAQSS